MLRALIGSPFAVPIQRSFHFVQFDLPHVDRLIGRLGRLLAHSADWESSIGAASPTRAGGGARIGLSRRPCATDVRRCDVLAFRGSERRRILLPDRIRREWDGNFHPVSRD